MSGSFPDFVSDGAVAAAVKIFGAGVIKRNRILVNGTVEFGLAAAAQIHQQCGKK
jgi:hypothetical protein